MTLLEKFILEWPKHPMRQATAFRVLTGEISEDEEMLSLTEAARRIGWHKSTLLRNGWENIKQYSLDGHGGRAPWGKVKALLKNRKKHKRAPAGHQEKGASATPICVPQPAAPEIERGRISTQRPQRKRREVAEKA